MSKLLIAVLAMSAVFMAGCASTATKTATAPAPAPVAVVAPAAKPAPAPTLSVDAQAALAEAKSYVAAAKSKDALWTKTAEAMTAAEAAAKAFDNAAVIKQATFAIETAKTSIAQLDLPSTNHFKK
ncbi:MAG: hypothetical protein HOP20_05140 [Sulfuriferula sp.]|nr:hypothetical protein [Sulfuriferula sp.]